MQAIVAWCEDGPEEVCGGATLGLGTSLLILMKFSCILGFPALFLLFSFLSEYVFSLLFLDPIEDTQAYKGMSVTYSGCELRAFRACPYVRLSYDARPSNHARLSNYARHPPDACLLCLPPFDTA